MEKEKKKKFLRIFVVIFALAFFLTIGWVVLKLTGLWEQLNSAEKLQQLILSMGFWGRSTFVFLQFLQVTFIPIPSPVLIAAGSLIYGPIEASILSFAGILLGSSVAFFLGRTFGKKLVVYMVGKESCKKWTAFFNKCKYTFVLMMLLPFFPDDILCLVAGLTNMSWGFFIATQFIARPIGILSVSYFAGGQIIPYHGWGLLVWGTIILVSGLALYLSNKYSEKIESFIKNIFSRRKI